MLKTRAEGRFTIRLNGCLQTYTRFSDIPPHFEELINFEPRIPLGPHTPQQHAEIELWEYRLQLLQRRT